MLRIFPVLRISVLKRQIVFTKPSLDIKIIKDYQQYRDFPALDHTTHLGVALRFGTVSVQKCVKFALEHSETWLNELIWREFFMQILFHFPYVVTQCFKKNTKISTGEIMKKNSKLGAKGKRAILS